MTISDLQVERYARHIVLPEVGGVGQAKIMNAKVLVIGAGGLGSPVILYLAAAGIGTIGIIDDDEVDLSNLQRQIIHTTAQIGTSKAESAYRTAKDINPNVTIRLHKERFTARNAIELAEYYDVVADGSDNFDTRFLVNDACYLSKTTLVSAAIMRFDGQVSTYKAYMDAGQGKHPCYRCLFPEPPPSDTVSSCAQSGVLGALCGVVGSLQAIEILREIVEFGKTLSGALLILDGLTNEFRKIRLKPDPNCALCSTHSNIKDLSLHTK